MLFGWWEQNPLTKYVFLRIFLFQRIIAYLRSKGHTIRFIDPYFLNNGGWGTVQAISIDDKSGIITANFDRRKAGEVDGF